MQALVQEGKVRYGGLSNYTLELMQRAMAVAPITSNQHQYNLLHPKIEHDVLPFSRASWPWRPGLLPACQQLFNTRL